MNNYVNCRSFRPERLLYDAERALLAIAKFLVTDAGSSPLQVMILLEMSVDRDYNNAPVSTVTGTE